MKKTDIPVSTMKRQRAIFAFFCIFLLITLNSGLKCRNPSQNPYDQDMEYAVRQCVRQMIANTTDQKETGLYSTLREWERPHRDDNGFSRPNRDVGKQNQENAPRLRERHPRPNRYGPSDIQNEDDGFGYQGQQHQDRRRYRGRERPHTVNQQSQFDRDTRFNNNRRPMFEPDPNFSRPSPSESRMHGIDPCMIFCVFQELKMLDDWGQLDKQAIIDQMTHRLRDREVRDFIQYTIEDCMNEQQQNDDRKSQPQSQHDRPESCRVVKNFAMCLEERGKQACEDWDEPIANSDKKPAENFPEREKPKESSKKGLKNSNRG